MKQSNNFDVQIIKEQLYECDFGDTVTFEELSALTGKDLQNEHYHILRRALMEMENEGYVFENIRNIGYRRLSDEERAFSDRVIVSINRKAERGIKQKTVGVDFDNMTRDAQITQNIHLYVLNATKKMGTKKVMKRLEGKIDRLTDKIEGVEDMLKLFKSANPDETRHDETRHDET